MKIYLPLISLGILVGTCYAGVRAPGHETQNPGDSAVARTIFSLADENVDGILSFSELDSVFTDFDLNGDGKITEHEFVTDWTSRGLGNVWDAITLFNNLDTEKDGAITEYPDLPRIQTFFDVDADGKVVQAEFVIQWVKLSSS